MAIKHDKKKHRRHNISYTVITAFLLCVVFLTMVASLYINAEEEAYENLHSQTKQIKDDITLQLVSDRENLATMANFAATLYSEEERYDIMFESFKPIGLIENIGILNQDNTFVTKSGVMDVSEYISFEEEANKGVYISSRVSDITTRGKEIVRSAVPIKSGDKTVGILYGVIQLDKIGARYNEMAKNINAQLFVYHKDTGDLIIDNIHRELGNISFLKERDYNKGYSYEQIMATEKGFVSFASAYKDENVYMHYSTIEDLNLVIAMVRYEDQVFAQVRELTNVLFLVFAIMLVIIILYVSAIMTGEKHENGIVTCASDVRKILLEISGNQNNITDALKLVSDFAGARSVVFFDSYGEDYSYLLHGTKGNFWVEDDINYFKTELFRYATDQYNISKATVNVLCIKPNKALYQTNPRFYNLLKQLKIKDISFSATINNSNHITILAAVNAKFASHFRILAEKISACFSMALYNKNYLNKTQLVATTDSLTGALNRVAYKNDLITFDKEQGTSFSCIYVDVNELHVINNKYGHAAGDEMLIYIANTLKEVFYSHKVYRMGGDEFLVFCQNVEKDIVNQNIEVFKEQLLTKKYHVAVGMSFRAQNTDTEKLVKEAEVRMYEEKAEYYQNKQRAATETSEKEYVQLKTGIHEIDTMLSILKENYNGIYRVSLDTDKVRRILMPAYLQYNENEEHFSQLFSNFVIESVDPDYHRAVMSFLNYEALTHQLMDGKIPRIMFKKNNGKSVLLSVYKLSDTDDNISDTLWVFAKAQNS
ncbi:MAG: GGDEF domain-containing protein [Acutalibacteraceae bacterium]|nr:GGDEF domain-containing protein [Acutalibacteraceae bacterium]